MEKHNLATVPECEDLSCTLCFKICMIHKPKIPRPDALAFILTNFKTSKSKETTLYQKGIQTLHIHVILFIQT